MGANRVEPQQADLERSRGRVVDAGHVRSNVRLRLRETISVVNPLALQSTAYRSMSSGTARLKRRLDDQGVNYTNKRASENFCLVRLTATEGLQFGVDAHLCLDRHSLASLGEKGRERICSHMETRRMPVFNCSLLTL